MGKNLKNLIVFFLGFLLLQPAFVFAYQKPSVSTLEATNITNSSVILNGKITDLGGFNTAVVYFQYGKTKSYDKQTPLQNFSNTGIFSATVSPLPSCTLYHFRAVAKNISGISYGADKTFIVKCAPLPPTVDLKANDSDNPLVIRPNTTFTLTWTSENAEYCFAFSGWTGNKPTSGSETIQNLNVSKTFAMTCLSAAGSATDQVMVNVFPNLAPTANAGPDKEVYEKESVILEGSGSDPNNDPLYYSWSCNGGSLSNSNSAKATFTAPTVLGDTTFDCTLTVTDTEGKSNSDLMQVLVKKRVVAANGVITTPQVKSTATLVSTGLTNNLFLDSFFLPLVMTLITIWLFKSHLLSWEEWLDERKKRYLEYRSKKLLQIKTSQIKAREFLHKKII